LDENGNPSEFNLNIKYNNNLIDHDKLRDYNLFTNNEKLTILKNKTEITFKNTLYNSFEKFKKEEQLDEDNKY